MRTTLNLSDAAFFAAKELAANDKLSLGEAVSRLIQQGLRVNAVNSEPPRHPYVLYGKRPGAPITSQEVYRLFDDMESEP